MGVSHPVSSPALMLIDRLLELETVPLLHSALGERGPSNKASKAKANPARPLISAYNQPSNSLLLFWGGGNLTHVNAALSPFPSPLTLEGNWHLSKRAIRM